MDLTLPVGDGIDLELQMPYDIKSMKAKYELPDGTPFVNPEGNLHHRSERLEGVSDFKLYGNINVDGWRFSAGLNLPVGEIEDDPWELGALGLKHQHIQFGTGTLDPLLRVSKVIHLAERIDLSAALGAQVSLYENRKGYQGPPQYDFAIGPRARIADWLSASATYSLLYQGRAYWDGDPDENTGYTIQGFQLSLPIRLESGLMIVPNAFRAFDVNTRGGGDTFELDWIVGLSLEIPLGGVAVPTEEPHH